MFSIYYVYQTLLIFLNGARYLYDVDMITITDHAIERLSAAVFEPDNRKSPLQNIAQSRP